MDAVFRLRVLIWVLVLGLWGVMVYQYLGEEELEGAAAMLPIDNPYRGLPLPAPPPGPPAGSPEEAYEQGRLLAQTPPAAPASGSSPSLAPSGSPLAPGAPPGAAETRPSSIGFVTPEPAPRPAPRPRPRPSVRPEQRLEREAPVPAGFVKTVTRHFVVYSEGAPASERFVRLLENLHGNLMLDLAPLSPWANDERVSIFLFKNQDTYRQVTGRPPWSGGASSVPKRKVYVYESEELPGILAHELCHIYFDGFFLEGQANPLWLSEGMATLVQVERGLAAPNWLRENMDRLERGAAFPIAELTGLRSTAGLPDERVRLWYAQSYSLVRFLIRSQYKSSFLKFCSHLRDGRDVTQALYRAYGMPFNRLKALEHAWRYDLTNRSLSRLSPSGN